MSRHPVARRARRRGPGRFERTSGDPVRDGLGDAWRIVALAWILPAVAGVVMAMAVAVIGHSVMSDRAESAAASGPLEPRQVADEVVWAYQCAQGTGDCATVDGTATHQEALRKLEADTDALTVTGPDGQSSRARTGEQIVEAINSAGGWKIPTSWKAADGDTDALTAHDSAGMSWTMRTSGGDKPLVTSVTITRETP